MLNPRADEKHSRAASDRRTAPDRRAAKGLAPPAALLAAAVAFPAASAAALTAWQALAARSGAPQAQAAGAPAPAEQPAPRVVARPEPLRDLGRRHKVRLVYFVPKDRRPTERWAEKIAVLMTFVNDLYARSLSDNGYARAGLDFEFRDGRPLVHFVGGERSAAEYSGEPNYDAQRQWRRILPEVEAALGKARENLYVVFAETYSAGPAKFEWPGGMALGARFSASGGVGMFSAWILRDEFCATTVEGQLRLLADETPIAGRTALHRLRPDSPRFEFIEDGFGAVAHELGHAFGLPHDRRADDVEIMGNGFRHLRNNYLATGGPKAAFMADSARMLRWSRFLSDDVDLADSQAPVARITHPAELRAGATTVLLRGEITDDKALGAVQFFSPRHDWVLGGMDLAGREVRLNHVLVVPPLEKGPLELVITIIDRGGNIATERVKTEVD